MINGFVADSSNDNVGPYKVGTLEQFEIYCDPNYNPDTWVMSCKSQDIRRNSALFGEYMPLTNTDAIGLANASVQQGYATMYAMKVVNPDTVVSGKILGVF
jgi:spore maturation protein SpmA